MIVTPDSGLIYLVADLIDNLAPYVHLYRNDPMLSQATVLADLEELDTPGYRPQKALGWSPPTMRAGQATTEADPLRWVRGVGGTPRDVYGYYVTDGAAGPLLWVQRGPAAPYAMRLVGDVILVTARYALGPCSAAPPAFGGDVLLGAVSTVGPAPIRATADLVLDGASSSSEPTRGLADLVLDGASSSSEPTRGLADLVLDGAAMPGPPLILGDADVVLDGLNESPLYPTLGHADVVLDGTGQAPYSPTLGDADSLLDGEPLP